MMQDNLIELKKPEAEFQDPLTEILRKEARQLPAQALEAEVSLFMEQFAAATDEKGRKWVVRNGYLPEREVQTGIQNPVAARVPRVRDREKEHAGKVRFNSTILPPYPRKTRSMEQRIPWLYLKGISTGDFTDALASLVGRDAQGQSPAIPLQRDSNPLGRANTTNGRSEICHTNDMSASGRIPRLDGIPCIEGRQDAVPPCSPVLFRNYGRATELQDLRYGLYSTSCQNIGEYIQTSSLTRQLENKAHHSTPRKALGFSAVIQDALRLRPIKNLCIRADGLP